MQRIVIYGELYSSKNSKRIVRFGDKPALIPSAQYLASVKPIEQQLVLNRRNWLSMIDGCSSPLKICFKIYRKTRRAFDYVNIIQGLQDMMVKCCWLPDDNANVMIPVFEPYEVDPKNPRVEIFLVNE